MIFNMLVRLLEIGRDGRGWTDIRGSDPIRFNPRKSAASASVPAYSQLPYLHFEN